MTLNPFPVIDLGPEVKLMHLLRMRRHYYHVWNTRHWTDSEFAWTLSCLSKSKGIKAQEPPKTLPRYWSFTAVNYCWSEYIIHNTVDSSTVARVNVSNQLREETKMIIDWKCCELPRQSWLHI